MPLNMRRFIELKKDKFNDEEVSTITSQEQVWILDEFFKIIVKRYLNLKSIQKCNLCFLKTFDFY